MSSRESKRLKRVCIPNRSTKTLNAGASRRSAGSAMARNGDRMRGRISVAKRRHGLTVALQRRCRMKRGCLGVIADNLINIGRAMEKRAAR